ncbi:MAG: hypothetical protein HFH94_16740 [Lachnospiraceae bacterium]|jgi:hypothetical protein|nr:hypothetical protein [Lachnospiraceae bacterium]
MREHSKMLLALVGSVAACFSMYSILKKTSQVSPKPNRAEAILLPDKKEISSSAKEFAERRKQRAMAKRLNRIENS